MDEEKSIVSTCGTTNSGGEIVLYQPNDEIRLDVRLENETVWLSQQQMATLFQATKQNISLHISNIYAEGELTPEATVKEYLTVQHEGTRQVSRYVKYYNLDVIISVGYRIKSIVGTRFRQWANKIIQDYLLRGYAVNARLDRIERRLSKTEEQIDFFVRTNLPPVEQVFFDGDFWEARVLLETLIKAATKRVVIIDNYIDTSDFSMLDVREKGVKATIYSHKDFADLRDLHNSQSNVEPIETIVWKKPSHDRWLIVDDTVYHCGHSLKDMGKKLCAIMRMGCDAETILNQVR